jgi:ATP-dependent DNA helicase RecG
MRLPNQTTSPLDATARMIPVKQRAPAKHKRAASGKSGEKQQASLQDKLAKLGIRSEFDLVLHLPLRYDDETKLVSIADLTPGASAQFEAEVLASEIHYRPRRQLIVQVGDGERVLYLRFFNFYPSQQKQLQPGTRIRVIGDLRSGFFGDEMVHPRYSVVRNDDSAPLPERLTPVYPTTAGLAQAALRQLIARTLDKLDLSDTLDAATLAELKLKSFAECVRYLHAPPPDAPLHALEQRAHPAWRRLKFDELLAQQLSMRQFRRARERRRAPVLPSGRQLTQQLLSALPFKLTEAQHRCLAEIRHDLARAHPMRRLLQGDVGSGKTIVAALACAQAIDAGYQAALMAPTEILAEQHFRKIDALLAPLGIRTAWLTGALRRKEKAEAIARVADGSAQLVIGTHALFQGEVKFKKLGLAVIDEQHRFGVAQRLALHDKGTSKRKGQETEPHQLMMSATPIPRTLSMSYFADLDVSVIDQLPPGRTPIVTKLVSDARRAEVIERVRNACTATSVTETAATPPAGSATETQHVPGGAQAYWVCPLIEESEALQLQTALDTYASIQQTFPDLRVGLVHGRMPATEKAQVMENFQRGAIQLLVATTVIEVGVDVPNASLMVIENAERMGLAQLHQLRGRVGRGAAQSVCILLYQNPLSETARERLRIIFENTDGFEIARQDLHMRGPGEFLGSRQSGVPLLRFADLERDIDLLEAARHLADRLIAQQPEIAERHVARWLSSRQALLAT